ncbi:hypothetical protein EUGRSUZ_K00899 [Eucalyptus grandis]|uniref:Uncharacterized protein n=2 Tax=Eucalyptus grandis TaxID=71139 RepID=A0ACC3IT14_EUCGR|nr:hypothetical protein EUGRSUZ_K00899 [Eucalyptus grandis]
MSSAKSAVDSATVSEGSRRRSRGCRASGAAPGEGRGCRRRGRSGGDRGRESGPGAGGWSERKRKGIQGSRRRRGVALGSREAMQTHSGVLSFPSFKAYPRYFQRSQERVRDKLVPGK